MALGIRANRTLPMLAVMAACSQVPDPRPACVDLRTMRMPGELVRSSNAVRFVAKRLGDEPWTHLPRSLSVFSVAPGRAVVGTSDSVVGYLLLPRWRTDARPLVLACHADTAFVLSGFPRSEAGALLHIGDAQLGGSDSAVINLATALAALLDTSAGEQLVLGTGDSASVAAATEGVRQRFGGRDLRPTVSASEEGTVVLLSVSSANRWGAVGLPDFIRFRFSYSRDGRLEWVDRVVVAGQSLVDRVGPDSVRIVRQ